MLTVLIGLTALVVLCLFGIPVLALLPGSARYRLLPGLPIFGAIYLIVVGHALAWAIPMSITAWIALAAAVVITVLGLRRNPVRWRSVRKVAPLGALVFAVGAVGATLAWLPSFLLRSHLLVQPSANLDAVWYVAAATWLKDHTLLQVPDIGLSPSDGMDSVLFGPAAEAAMNFTRLGQEMVLATLTALTGIDLIAGFSAWLGIWVLLGASAAWVFGEMFRLSSRSRLALGLLLSVSSVLIYQVAAQNASSLLGIALMVAAIGAVGSALRRDGNSAVPKWLAGASVSAALGAYSEYFPFIALALVALTLIAPRREILPRLVSALVIVGFSIVLAPIVWFKTVGSILFLGGIASGGGGQTVFSEAAASLLGPLSSMINGTTGKLQFVAVTAAVAVAIVAVLGLIFGLVSSRTRGFVVGAGLGSLTIAGYLIFTANGYIGHRAVDMITPMVTLAAGVGWIEFTRFARRWPLGARRGAQLVTVGALVGVAGVNFVYSAYSMTYREWTDHAVTEDFSEVEDWAEANVDSSGDDLTVAAGTIWDQLWLAEALVDRPDVAWINLRGDLGYRANNQLTSFWDGELDRYVLLGPGAFASSDVDPAYENDRFSLIDWTSTEGVVAVPDSTNGSWEWVTSDGIANSASEAGVRVLAGSAGGDYVMRVDRLTPGGRAEVAVNGEEFDVPVSADGTAQIPFTIASNSSIEITVLSQSGFRLQGVELTRKTQ